MTKRIISILLLICTVAALAVCKKETAVTPDDTMEMPDTTAADTAKEEIDFDALDPNMTEAQKAAVQAAQDAIDVLGYSRKNLIVYLEMEGHATEDAEYAVDILDIDWKEQALNTATFNLMYSPYSYNGIIDLLEYSGFSHEDAVYAADNCDVDWDAQAVQYISKYNMYNSFSREALIDELVEEGFTEEQAVQGIKDYEESKETE